jgi:hypothetical protein
MASVTLQDHQQCRPAIRPVTRRGQPAPIDGVPVWAVSDPTIVELTPEADGMRCLVRPVGPAGDAQVRVEADADMGAGVIPIIGLLDVKVLAGLATIIDVLPGPVEDQPLPEPVPPLP